MATTTKFDTSTRAIVSLGLPEGFWSALKGKSASRWGGVSNPRWECWTFRVQLPSDLAHAWQLFKALEEACGRVKELAWGTVRKPLHTLKSKLMKAMGISESFRTTSPVEVEFWKSICENPTDTATWAIFSDWLSENADWSPDGLTIARWVAPGVYSQKQAKKDRDDAMWEEIKRKR